MGIYGNKFLSINEVYYGKSDTLLDMENQIGIIRNKIHGTYMVNIDGAPEVIAFNRLVEKQFGMDTFALHIENYAMKNAWTTPIACRFDVVADKNFKSKVHADKHTFKFTPNNNLCIVVSITTGLINDKTVTNEELLAILLHEIGHNFADAIDNKIYLYDAIPIDNYINYYTMSIIADCLICTIASTSYNWPLFIAGVARAASDVSSFNALQNNTSAKAKENSEKTEKEKTSFFNTLRKTINGFFYDVSGGFYKLLNTITLGAFSWLYVPLAKVIANINSQAKNEMVPKTNEMMADKFSAMWGYSTPLSTGLAKIENNPGNQYYIIDHIPVVGILARTAEIPNNMIADYCDVHPNIIQRIDNQISTLQYEVDKKDMDPKLKAIAVEDIKELKELRNNLTKNDKIILSNPDSFKEAWLSYLGRKTPDKLMKKVDNRLNKEIDNFVANKNKKGDIKK